MFSQGIDITLAGLLTGSKKGLIGEIEYTYPVFDAREIYLFKEETSYPYPYWYDPFYYPPFYYPHVPFWYRP
ncbi:MAG: Slp family lipoprotein [Thermodesulfovibrionales bacterium]